MTAPQAFPRTLFATPAAFNHVTGGGITFSNLFRGWPDDRLATVHNDSVPTTDDVCRLYYRLGPAEIARWPRLRAPASGGPGENAPAPEAPTAAAAPGRSTARAAKRLIAGNGWPDSGRLSPALEAWIETFRPELLYTILGTIGMMEVVDAIRRRFDLPLVVHFMDDWPSHLYRGGLFSFAMRARMNTLIRRLVDGAAERMAIGDAMAAAYEERYGVPFTVFQNAVDIGAVDRWIGEAERSGTDGHRPGGRPGALQVLYIGSVFDNAQAQSLIEVARAVTALSAQGRNIRFDMYSPLHLAERFRPQIEIAPCIGLHDTITDDARFYRTIAEADVLVMPVNFDADSVRLIRYSMPTKLPAYLASGTATLVYGPAGVAQVEDARRHGWGHVVDRQGTDHVAAALTRLADDAALRTSLTDRARALAVRRHDAATVRNDFQARLAAAAESSTYRSAATAPAKMRKAG